MNKYDLFSSFKPLHFCDSTPLSVRSSQTNIETGDAPSCGERSFGSRGQYLVITLCHRRYSRFKAQSRTLWVYYSAFYDLSG